MERSDSHFLLESVTIEKAHSLLSSVSYCVNPDCFDPHNPEVNLFCQSCGTKLLLAERYRAINPIGAGGFGKTFLAEDESQPSKPRCVIKQFNFCQGKSECSPSDASKAGELFQQEAARLEQLGKHPQIPELFAYFEQDSYHYIVQEFIDGQNLAQELAENGAFSEAQIRSLLKALLPVLQFLHQGKIIHRDIKPENIVRRRLPHHTRSKSKEELALVDFGAAKYATVTTLAKTGTTIGSPGYAAPEQTFGKAVFASDIYSLAVTCIHLLTEVSPFDLYDAIESGFVWRDYLVDNPVGEELGGILDKMVESAVRQRYQSAEEVMQALSGKGMTQSPSATPTTSPASPPATRPSKKTSRPTTLSKGKGAVFAIAISPDGQLLASGSGGEWSLLGGKENAVRIWNLESEELLYNLTRHSEASTAVAFSPCGQVLASGSQDQTIKLWDISNGQQLRTLEQHSYTVNSVTFSPDGQLLASGSEDGTIKLWEVSNGEQLRSIDSLSSEVYSVAFSPDGQRLAIGSMDQTIKLWEVRTGEQLRPSKGHSDLVLSVAFSPEGEILASGSGDWDCTVKLWEVRTGQVIHTLRGHSWSVCSVAFTPDGEVLASGSMDQTIKLWEVRTGRMIRTLKGHSSVVNSVVLSPDGPLLVSGSEDETIKIWQLN